MPTSRAELTHLALAHGFDVVRVATVRSVVRADAFERWLAAHHHGSMTYLDRAVDVRREPRRRLPEAVSALALAVHHAHATPPDPGGRTGRVARYAWGRDYHNLVGKRLRRLRRSLRELGINNWGGVDTAPILERAWAATAGLGFSGKNGCQILPATSSWFLLAVLFVDLPVTPDPPLGDHCGRCVRCLSGCPTQAFVAPRVLDARRCISYWTIEARELAPASLRPAFGRWVFGCDVCQEVCPHNVTPPPCDEPDFAPRHAFLDLDEILRTPDAALIERFTGTPLRRPGGVGLKRNALVALGNLDDPGALPSIEASLAHPHPVVRAAAVWALRRLGEQLPATWTDPDPRVRAEAD